MVADVEVSMKTGKIVAKHLYVAHDNGITVDPDLVGEPGRRRVDPGPVARAARSGSRSTRTASRASTG